MPDIDAMTVVIQKDGFGSITEVFTALPIRVIEVDHDGHGGERPTRPLAELPKFVGEDAVLAVLDPFRHLTGEQRDKIRAAAKAELLAHCKENRGYTEGVLDSYVGKMSIEDQLECISPTSDETVDRVLGFVPETGEPYRDEPDPDDEPAEPDEDEGPEQLVWVPDLGTGAYHWLRTPADEPDVRTDATRTGKVACGARLVFVADKAVGVPAGDQPPGVGCPQCLKHAGAKRPSSFQARVRKLFWGRTNVGAEKKWHAFLDKPVALPREKSTISKHFKTQKYAGTPLCGLVGVNVVGVTEMKLDENPHPSEKSELCLNCVDRVQRLRIDNQ